MAKYRRHYRVAKQEVQSKPKVTKGYTVRMDISGKSVLRFLICGAAFFIGGMILGHALNRD